MKNFTINTFENWDLIDDYESDETTVTLLSKGVIIAEFGYGGFTKSDFDRFKGKEV